MPSKNQKINNEKKKKLIKKLKNNNNTRNEKKIFLNYLNLSIPSVFDLQRQNCFPT